MRVLVFNGAPRRSAVNLALTQVFVEALVNYTPITLQVLHLHQIASDVGCAESLLQLPDSAAEAYQQALDADLIIFIVPQYAAGLPGLFCHFFELLDPTALRGKVALIAATGSGLYSPLLDTQLRPLLDKFGLFVMPVDSYLPHAAFAQQPGIHTCLLSEPQALARIRFSTQQAVSLVAAKLRSAA
ncbi:NAD(P)H-dependent oxidoreductase [Rheinheimera muenzenbergensis]|uniref:NAD(P)H-dependent oxidoreductase n=1 Tax=Rheinheimera muenzenbergensis TaxID=1193628 RepID=A0ABU8C3W8_9GAMM